MQDEELYVTPIDIPALGALRGDFIHLDGSGKIAICREVSESLLTPEIRARLIPRYPHRFPVVRSA